MAAQRDSVELEARAQILAKILIRGGKRSDCVLYAAENWGVGERQAQNYLTRARELIRADWSDVERDQMMAEILSQYSTLQVEAREQGQLHVALGCIHGAAKLAQLVV